MELAHFQRAVNEFLRKERRNYTMVKDLDAVLQNSIAGLPTLPPSSNAGCKAYRKSSKAARAKQPHRHVCYRYECSNLRPAQQSMLAQFVEVQLMLTTDLAASSTPPIPLARSVGQQVPLFNAAMHQKRKDTLPSPESHRTGSSTRCVLVHAWSGTGCSHCHIHRDVPQE